MLFSGLKKIIAGVIVLIQIVATMALGDPAGTPVVVNQNATNQYITVYGKPLIFAHRSGAGIAPQNTLMAYQECLDSTDFDIDVFEGDVQITKDGQLVFLHNSTYDSTSNAVEAFGHDKIKPSDYTFEQLQVLNLGENFSVNGAYPYRGLRGKDIPQNLRVMKVEDILDYVLAHEKKDYHFSIEIKSLSVFGMRAADRLHKILVERNLVNRTIVSTFVPAVKSYIVKKYPDLQRAAAAGEAVQFYLYCREGKDLNELHVTYKVLHLPFGTNVMPKRKDGTQIGNFGTRQVINYAHKYNIAVQFWTVNNAADMIYLRDNGADGIMTDYPDLAGKTLGR